MLAGEVAVVNSHHGISVKLTHTHTPNKAIDAFTFVCKLEFQRCNDLLVYYSSSASDVIDSPTENAAVEMNMKFASLKKVWDSVPTVYEKGYVHLCI